MYFYPMNKDLLFFLKVKKKEIIRYISVLVIWYRTFLNSYEQRHQFKVVEWQNTASLYKIFHPSIDFLSRHFNQVMFTIVPVSDNRNVIYPVEMLFIR